MQRMEADAPAAVTEGGAVGLPGAAMSAADNAVEMASAAGARREAPVELPEETAVAAAGAAEVGRDKEESAASPIRLAGPATSRPATQSAERAPAKGHGLPRALRAKIAVLMRELKAQPFVWPFLDPVPVDQVRSLHC